MADAQTISDKQAGVSLLRLIATAAVIACHVSSTITTHPETFAQTAAQNAFLQAFGSVVNWHVPVFFMISGALLLDRRREVTPAMCVGKYARRIFLALAVFGIPFALMKHVFEARTLTAGMLWQSVLDVINGDSWDHLWYLYALIGLYLLLPVFKGFVNGASRREQGYVLAVLMIFDFAVYVLDRVMKWQIAFTVPATYPVFYFLMGHYLAEGTPKLLRSRGVCIGIVLGMAAGTVAVCASGLPQLGVLYQYQSPLNALAACAAFVLFTKLDLPERWCGWLWKLDRLCFGVYLVHPVFIHFTYRFLGVTPLSFAAYPAAALLFFVAFTALSFFASWVMSLIPPLKKYVL